MVLSWRKLAPPLGYSGALANDMQAPLGSSELTFAACAPCKCFPMIIVHSFCRALEETSVVPCSLQKPHPWSVLDLPECNLNAVRLRVTSLDALHSIWHYVSCWTLCRNDDTVFFFWCPLPVLHGHHGMLPFNDSTWYFSASKAPANPADQIPFGPM